MLPGERGTPRSPSLLRCPGAGGVRRPGDPFRWGVWKDTMRKILIATSFLVASFAASAAHAEILTVKGELARLYMQGLYPAYILYLKGGIPEDTSDNWVDQPYWAVLDVHGGPEAGKSLIVRLVNTSESSPQPEWCITEGAEEFGGHGPACINTDAPKSMNQLRFKVRVQYANVADQLPAEFQDRDWSEYPELPGRRESEVFGPAELHIIRE